MHASFEILYDGLPVGVLEYTNGKWFFSYTETFKGQASVKPISDFPDIKKTYTSEVLWPFFAVRIPGLKQPKVLEVMERSDISPRNQVELLRTFGRHTIANPYKLVPVE